MSKKLALIANPVSGGFAKMDLARLEGMATSHGYALDLLSTERPGHAEELAREAVKEGFDIVVAAGGDGTISETANGMAGSGTPLGFIPLGTANVLARETGIPNKPEEALEAALTRNPRAISLGHIEAGPSKRHFCLMAGIGFDAEVVHSINTRIKRYLGKSAYVLKAVERLALWSSPNLRITVDGAENLCNTAIVCKARRYGGGFVMAPAADITKPEFEVIMLKRPGRASMLSFALAFSAGKHLTLKGVEVVKGKEIAIEGDAHIQIDGDDFGGAPALIRAVPEALRLVF